MRKAVFWMGAVVFWAAAALVVLHAVGSTMLGSQAQGVPWTVETDAEKILKGADVIAGIGLVALSYALRCIVLLFTARIGLGWGLLMLWTLLHAMSVSTNRIVYAINRARE
jgi:hypothetical protein